MPENQKLPDPSASTNAPVSHTDASSVGSSTSASTVQGSVNQQQISPTLHQKTNKGIKHKKTDRKQDNEKGRQDLLLKMYDQLYNDINRYYSIVWQSISALVGVSAIFALVEKNIIPLDIACSLAVLISSWVIAHIYDAGYWYNRNLVIIANIERQFLRPSDLHDIHYYFKEHRATGKIITHLRIDRNFCLSIFLLVLVYHFVTRVMPGFHTSIRNFNLQRALPYITACVCAIGLRYNGVIAKQKYAEFKKTSPGKTIKAPDIHAELGHPTTEKSDIRSIISKFFAVVLDRE